MTVHWSFLDQLLDEEEHHKSNSPQAFLSSTNQQPSFGSKSNDRIINFVEQQSSSSGSLATHKSNSSNSDSSLDCGTSAHSSWSSSTSSATSISTFSPIQKSNSMFLDGDSNFAEQFFPALPNQDADWLQFSWLLDDQRQLPDDDTKEEGEEEATTNTMTTSFCGTGSVENIPQGRQNSNLPQEMMVEENAANVVGKPDVNDLNNVMDVSENVSPTSAAIDAVSTVSTYDGSPLAAALVDQQPTDATEESGADCCWSSTDSTASVMGDDDPAMPKTPSMVDAAGIEFEEEKNEGNIVVDGRSADGMVDKMQQQGADEQPIAMRTRSNSNAQSSFLSNGTTWNEEAGTECRHKMEVSEQQQHFWRQDRLIKWLMNLACTKKVGGRRRGRKKSNKTAVALKKMRGSVQKGEENRPMPKRGQTTKKCKKCCGKTTFGVSGAVKPLQNPRSSSKKRTKNNAKHQGKTLSKTPMTSLIQGSGVEPVLIEESREQLYCICRQPYNEFRFYVGCDGCDDWFHPECVGSTQKEMSEMEAAFFCPNCRKLDVVENGQECLQG